MNKDEFVILVDFDEPGMRELGITEITQAVEEQSRQAIDNALKAITWIAEKTKAALDAAHQRPDKAEIEFGIKVGTKAGILVSEADAEFHIKAKLVWKKKEDVRDESSRG